MAHIDYYFSPTSPYSYLAGTRPGAVAQKHGATIAYKPVDLSALYARTGGLPPLQRHPARQEYRLIEIERSARLCDMPIHAQPEHWPTNPAPASYAIIAAQSAGGGDLAGLAAALTRACWAEQKNVADEAVIKACLEGAGFPASLADSGLLAGAVAYENNLEDAVNAGVFGAPFFVLDDGTRFWGQDRIDHLDMHLEGTL